MNTKTRIEKIASAIGPKVQGSQSEVIIYEAGDLVGGGAQASPIPPGATDVKIFIPDNNRGDNLKPESIKRAEKMGELAWQLRSFNLILEGGHVMIDPVMDKKLSKEERAVIAGRAAEINQIIDQDGLKPRSLADLVEVFNDLENKAAANSSARYQTQFTHGRRLG